MKKRRTQVNELKIRIDFECRRKGLSLTELARSVGKDRQGFYGIIRRGDMKASLLLAISKVLEVPMELIMTPVAAEEVEALQKTIGKSRAQALTDLRGEGTRFFS